MSEQPGSLQVAAVVGSLRSGSLSRRVLAALRPLAPPDVVLSEVPIRDLPLYDGDLDGDVPPPAVARFKESLGDGDGLLVVSPEYNHSVPGTVKNALDWASRPAFAGPLVGMPAAVVGVSPSVRNAPRRVISETALVLSVCLAEVMPGPELAITGAKEVVDADGAFTDGATLEGATAFMAAFAAHVRATAGTRGAHDRRAG